MDKNKLKKAIKKVYNKLVKEYKTDEIPLFKIQIRLRKEGFDLKEKELETFIENNPDCLK